MNLGQIKEVIVLKGLNDSGKTGILCRLCQSYKKQFGASSYFEDRCYKNGVDKVARVQLPDGRVLGVGTAGDNADTVLASFMSFHDQGKASPSFKDGGCDIVVLAVRTLSQRRHVISSYAPRLSLAEIELEELTKSYGASWRFLLPPGKIGLTTTKFQRGNSGFKTACANNANSVLTDLRAMIGF